MAESPSFRTGYDYDELKQKTAGLVWDVATLSWVKMTQPGTEPIVPNSMLVDTSSPPLIYVGSALPGSSPASAVWKIALIDSSVISVKHANGEATYINVWNNRASLSYS